MPSVKNEKAYAKINLTLEVLGRRADGYHEVATVLQEIDLKDTLSFEERRGISVDCDHPSLKSSQNLALQAARLLQEVAGSRKGASILIKKGIPVAAGLGGGASDAVATLRALNQIWELGLSRHQLVELASKLGSDTAFFLYGGTALGEGRGERITPLPPSPASWVVLLRPPVDVPPGKTESLYASLNPSHFTEGRFTKRVVDLLYQGEEIPPSSFFNAFERVAFTVFSGLEEYWQRFSALGADNIHLAGSGPTLFTVVRDKAQGEGLYRSLRTEGLEAYLVQTMARR
jgi:4-diphosphocytidyl-2-C-methyl-D-erythritol kinase